MLLVNEESCTLKCVFVHEESKVILYTESVRRPENKKYFISNARNGCSDSLYVKAIDLLSIHRKSGSRLTLILLLLT